MNNEDNLIFARKVNLASPKAGAKIVDVSDEFFAKADRMLSDKDPLFLVDKYDDHGKWMDGWESRRKRVEGNDWVIIQLGGNCSIKEAIVDTSHFTGNYPPYACLDYSCQTSYNEGEMNWLPLLEKKELTGDFVNEFPVLKNENVNFVRLNIFPDGGVARLRLLGDLTPWTLETGKETELSSLLNGGKIIGYNNAHYGDVNALLSEGRGKTMGDGWETRRRRVSGHDYIIIELGVPGHISKIEIDTCHFKGNFPDRASIQTINIPSDVKEKKNFDNSESWDFILNEQKCSADTVHTYKQEDLLHDKPVSHVRLNIYPDGGVSRLRIYGNSADRR